MDSQENALQQGMVEDEQKAAEPTAEVQNTQTEPTAPTEPVAEEPAAEPRKVYGSKQEVLDRVKEIAASVDNPDKEEVEHLKSLFY